MDKVNMQSPVVVMSDMRGDALCLKEKWISVHHCCNEHIWGDPEKIDGTRWLTPGSTSHQALQSIVLNKTLIKALAQMTLASHTGTLEVYHSLLLKYCEKRNHFSTEGMIVRTALAALDNKTAGNDSGWRS